ncbi:MAG: hypothetical protein WC614_11970 [bacterium]
MKYFYLLLGFILLNGCVATIENTSRTSYVKENFNTSSIEKGGIALLPIVAGAGQESLRRPLGDSISYHIKQYKSADTKFFSYKKTAEILNTSGLTEKYQKLISAYKETAIIDKAIIKEMGDTLKVQYLLAVSLNEFNKTSELKRGIISGQLHTEKTVNVTAFAQIWDSNGDVVWEGEGSAKSSASGELNSVEENYDKYCGVAAQGLAEKIFNINKD